jgi:hypothetical protein
MDPQSERKPITHDRDVQAIASFEMISRAEARIRIYVGAAIWIATLFTFLLFGSELLSSGAWVTCATAGVVVQRMGIESQ